MNWQPRALTALVALLAISIVAGCGSSDDGSSSSSTSSGGGSSTEASGDPYIIGAAVAQSGFLGPTDGPALEAAKMAADDLNKKGGIEGHPVKIVTVNTKSEPKNGAAAVRTLIDKGAKLILTSCDFSGGANANLAAAGQKVVAISLCAGSTSFTSSGFSPYVYSLGNTDWQDGTTSAEFAYKKLGLKTAYVLTDDFIQYTKNTCTYFKERYEQMGGKVVGEDTFSNADPSIATQVSAIKALSPQPEMIQICSLPPGGASAVKQIRAAGIEVPIVTMSGFQGTYWLDAVPGLSNFYNNTKADLFGHDPSKDVNDFVARYTKETGKPPAQAFVIIGYSDIQAVAAAAKKAGSIEPDKIKEALDTFDNVPTMMGPISFDKEKHYAVSAPIAVQKIDNGKVKFQDYWDVEQFPPIIK